MLDKLRKFEREVCLDSIYSAAIANRFPIAIWMLPKSQHQNAIVDLSGRVQKCGVRMESLPSGFVVAPFFLRGSQPCFLIENDLYWDGSTMTLNTHVGDLNGSESTEVRLKQFVKDLNRKTSVNGQPQRPNWFVGRRTNKQQSVNNDVFCNQIDMAIQKIRTTGLRKVVVSRAVDAALARNFDPVQLFHNLCEAYPNAFVSLVAIPDVGTWIGATPELLLQVKNNRLRTVALAGTQGLDSNADWSSKELEEQAIVSDYIRECFLQKEITDYTEYGPETMNIGRLRHLRTEFNLTLNSTSPAFTSEFLRLLHPTPAVGGVPKKAALDFIQQVESHDREFYSGFLGPVNFDGASHLFVNLRCLQLLEGSTILYAGSGITAESVADQECSETELKLRALSTILNKTTASRGTQQPAARQVMAETVLMDE